MQEELHKELWDRDERISINKIEVNPDKVFKIQEGIEVNGQKIPDPKKHQIISFTKSGIRILGYIFLPFSLEIATILLILSEVVGIIEELV
jgi:hypothetical protein